MYSTVLDDLQNTVQMFMQRKKAYILFSLQYCCRHCHHVVDHAVSKYG